MGFGSIKCYKWYYYCQGQSDTKTGMHSFYSAILWHHSVSQKSLCLSVFQILTLQVILVIKMHIVLWLAKLIECSFLLSYYWLPWHPTNYNHLTESSPIAGVFINYPFMWTPGICYGMSSYWGQLVSHLSLTTYFYRTLQTHYLAIWEISLTDHKIQRLLARTYKI